jgi:hypothetical protein
MQNVFRDLPYELLNYRGLIPLPIQFICHDMKTFSTSKDPKERIRSLLFKILTNITLVYLDLINME